jgi:glycosyltransferase involved in cell wall biosynthesis
MRILIISDHSDPLAKIGSKEAGGQNVYLYYLGKYLGQAGVKVDVFTRWDQRNKRRIVNVSPNFRVIRVKAGPKGFLERDKFLHVLDEFTENILGFIAEEKKTYDLIHSNYWFSGLSGLQIKNRLGLPMVHVYHSIGEIRFRILKKFKLQKRDYFYFQKRVESEKKIAQEADGIIATSPEEKRTLLRLFKVDSKKINMITIGVDRRIFYPMNQLRARKKLGLSETKKLLVYAGRIEWRKGVGTLLYSLKQVIKTYPDTKLYIIGGAKSAKLKKLEQAEIDRQQQTIRDLGLEDNVRYTGPKIHRRLRLYYNAADICVVPSYYEPFGIVPIEAMACGTPVVASKTGGLSYSVHNGKTGFLAKPRDRNELAEKILMVLERGKDQFKDQCLKAVKQKFDWEKISKEYIKYFNLITKQK